MIRPVGLLLLSMVFVLIAAPDAAAKSWWGWLEEFSGPGEFRARSHWGAIGYGPHFGLTICPAKTSDDLGGGFLHSPIRAFIGVPASGARWCGFVDGRTFSADASPAGVVPRFPATDAIITDVGITYVSSDRLLELGAGVGRIAFHVNDEEVSDHFLLTLPRVSVRVAYLIPDLRDRDRRSRWHALSALKLWAKWHYLESDLDGADFGIPREAFFAKREVVRSTGFQIDVFEATCHVVKRLRCGPG